MRFNTQTLSAIARKDRKTRNCEGAPAYGLLEKLELVTILLTSKLQDQFYRGADQTAQRVMELIDALPDKQFAAKAAVYGRRKGDLRSVTHLVAAHLAGRVHGEKWARPFYGAVVRRADDVLEILSAYLAMHGKPIPNSLKKGLGQALARFDEYQIRKYAKARAGLKMVDAVNLLHPPHTEALRKLVMGDLAVADTWETRLTQAGQKAATAEEFREQKGAAFSELLRERKLGYLALLRNLRNIIDSAPDAAEAAIAQLTDERQVRKSGVLPFQFYTAYQTLSGESRKPEVAHVLSAINDATELSLANVPRLEGRTLIALDGSGSMVGFGSAETFFNAAIFAAAIYKTNADADLMWFSNRAHGLNLNRKDTLLTLVEKMRRAVDGGGTDLNDIFRKAGKAYENVVILSDMQSWVSWATPTKEFAKYRKRTGADPRVFSFDVTGYGSIQFPERQVYALAGIGAHSLKILRFLAAPMAEKEALVREIEAVEF